ncbi:MAG: EAL domain-containing protein [Chloroflexales bacterium]|nr:EAL domain-containing protein [Chloroflexales bacterium]
MKQPSRDMLNKCLVPPPGLDRRLAVPVDAGEVARRTRFFWLTLDLLAIIDQAGRILDLNQAWTPCLGIGPGDLVLASLADLAHPDDRPLVESELARLAGGADAVAFEARLRTAGNDHRWLGWHITRDQHSALLYAVGHDISRQKRAELDLRASEQRFHQLIDAAPEATWVIELPERRVSFFNREEFCGYQHDEVAPTMVGLVHRDDRAAVIAHCERISTARPEAASYDEAEYRFWRRDGGIEWVHSRAVVLSRGADGLPRQVVFTLSLITDRKYAEQLLDYHARYDLVTGLPNRFFFSDRLEERISRAHARGERFALCVFDLDRFNHINDALGHTAGDDVLAHVAERLRRSVGADDVLARMGGDEFTLILAGTGSAEEAVRAARRMLSVLEEPITLDGHELFISASVGISLFPGDATDATTLLKHADNAMYRAKAVGRNSVSWFVPELGRAMAVRLEVGNQLRRAIDQQQFELHYQPQISLVTGRVVGVEALIRWRHPERGMIAPADFVPVAEEGHLMARISAWVIYEACRQAAEWQRAGLPPMRIGVNISAGQFERDDVVQRSAAALRQTGLEPQWLDLEITESVLMRDPEGSALHIKQLRAMGVRVSIDDFGTGYSSLAYLQRFPVDALKIDRSFVRALGGPGDGPVALVQAIIALSHSLGLDVVAEGVESPEQRGLLRDLGCNEAQGFLFARPAPADQVWEAIRALNRATGAARL